MFYGFYGCKNHKGKVAGYKNSLLLRGSLKFIRHSSIVITFFTSWKVTHGKVCILKGLGGLVVSFDVQG